jgi:SAM-dependent methyltransferase
MLTDSFSVNDEKELYASYSDFALTTDHLCRQYIWRAFEELGWKPSDHVLVTPEDVFNKLDIQNNYQRLIHRLLEIVGQWKEGRWLLNKPQERLNIEVAISDAKKAFPTSVIELEILEKSGGHLAQVLGGSMDPLQLFFSGNTGPTADYLYRGTGISKLLNKSLSNAVKMIVEGLPSSHDIKILEIGAGTGGSTREIAPALSSHGVEYYFTDISGTLLEKAKIKFKDYKFMYFQKLDIEKPVNEQGYQDNDYSVIIAANVLHATEDVSVALAHTRQLLAPGGILVLLEGTRKQIWLDMIFGLLPGWWKFQDSIRHNYPLISIDQWLCVLRALKYSDPAAFIPHMELGQTIILATAPD